MEKVHFFNYFPLRFSYFVGFDARLLQQRCSVANRQGRQCTDNDLSRFSLYVCSVNSKIFPINYTYIYILIRLDISYPAHIVPDLAYTLRWLCHTNRIDVKQITFRPTKFNRDPTSQIPSVWIQMDVPISPLRVHFRRLEKMPYQNTGYYVQLCVYPSCKSRIRVDF
jgi:hypothetical protein